MAKVIALGPGGKAQAPERDDRFRAVIDAVRSTGRLDQLLLSPPVKSHEQADDMRRGLFRSARYYCSCGGHSCTRRYPNTPHEAAEAGGCPGGGQRISCRADVVTVPGPDGKRLYAVQFTLHDKAEAIRAVIDKYGPDPNNWPYFSKRKQSREE